MQTQASGLEWIGDLSPEVLRNNIVLQAESLGPPVSWHIVGAKQNINKREQPGEVLVESLVLGRVMPAMEFRAGNELAEPTESPGHIGMNEDCVEREERHVRGNCQRTEAHENQR